MEQENAAFRWAVLGTGPVSRKFLLGLKAAPGHKVVVAASRTAANAQAFARDLGVPESADYAAAAAHPGIDAVYIATPPSLHEEHALMAIAAGKPVLIEKPFALDGAAAARIAEAARAANVFAMEAMWTRFLPLTAVIRSRIDAGAIGAPRAFHGAFWGADIPDPGASLYDPARGGGALMHRGVYPLSLAIHLLGPVTEMQAMGQRGETGVDEDCALSLRHASGAISTLRASLRAAGPNTATVHGTEGTIVLEPPLYRPFRARLYPTRPRKAGTGGPPGRAEALKEGGLAQGVNQRAGWLKGAVKPAGQGLTAYFEGNGYHYEALAVAAAVAGGQTEHSLMPLDESVAIMDLVDRARATWAT